MQQRNLPILLKFATGFARTPLVSLLAEEAGLTYTDGNMFTLSIRKEYFQCPSQFPVAVF